METFGDNLGAKKGKKTRKMAKMLLFLGFFGPFLGFFDPPRPKRKPRPKPSRTEPSRSGPSRTLSPQANSRRLTLALSSARVKRTGQKLLRFDRRLGALNCYACHERDGKGGVMPAVAAVYQWRFWRSAPRSAA